MQIDTQVSAASNLPISIFQRHVVPFRLTAGKSSKADAKSSQAFSRQYYWKSKTGRRHFNGRSIWRSFNVKKCCSLYIEEWNINDPKLNLPQIITKIIQSPNWEFLELARTSISHVNQYTPLQGERAGLSPSTLTAKKSSQSKCNPYYCGKPDWIPFHLSLSGHPAATTQ